MSKRNILWLYGELPKLVSKGVLTPDITDKLKEYYGSVEKKDFGQILLAVFGTIGAVLIILGIILLFAFNWDSLIRPVKVLLAFLPLILSQGIVVFVILKKRDSLVWKEASGVFLTGSVGACIGLISQIYHIPGDLGGYLFTWMLLIFPVIYILDTNIVTLLYIIGITSWSCYAQADGDQAVFFWIFLLFAIPRLLFKYKENRYSNVSVFTTWILALCLCITIGVTLEKIIPGLWLVVYSSFFAVLYMIGFLWFREAPTIIQRPFHSIGTIGIIFLACLFTYVWPWKEIGWEFFRSGKRFHDWAGNIDYIICGITFLSAVGLNVYSVIKKKYANIIFGIFPLIISICYFLMAFTFDKNYGISSNEQDMLLVIHIVLNLYILVLGIISILIGTKNRKLLLINGGTLIIAVLIALRFVFVEHFFENLIIRGIVFILLGAAFLVTNIFFAGYFKKLEKTS